MTFEDYAIETYYRAHRDELDRVLELILTDRPWTASEPVLKILEYVLKKEQKNLKKLKKS